MCLVDKKRVVSALGEKSADIDRGVKKIVEIAYYNVAKLGVGEGKLVGANLPFLCNVRYILCYYDGLFKLVKLKGCFG